MVSYSDDNFKNIYRTFNLKSRFDKNKLYFAQYGRAFEYMSKMSSTNDNSLMDLFIKAVGNGKTEKTEELEIIEKFKEVRKILRLRFGMGLSDEAKSVRDNMRPGQRAEAMDILCYIAKHKIYRRGLVNLYEKCDGNEDLFVNNIVVMCSGRYDDKKVQYNLVSSEISLFTKYAQPVDYGETVERAILLNKSCWININYADLNDLDKLIDYDSKGSKELSGQTSYYVAEGEREMENVERKYDQIVLAKKEQYEPVA